MEALGLTASKFAVFWEPAPFVHQHVVGPDNPLGNCSENLTEALEFVAQIGNCFVVWEEAGQSYLGEGHMDWDYYHRMKVYDGIKK